MNLEETLEYRSYLCLARICGTLYTDNLGSEGFYDDWGYFESHITELFGADIDRVFWSQHVGGVFGGQRWAFADPANDFKGDDLEARLFHDRDHDVYYLVNRPTQTRDDNLNNAFTALGLGIPDKFLQVAQLMDRVRPEFRDKIVLSGFSLGGGLSAYAAVHAWNAHAWPVRTIVFDPLGLNRKMMGRKGLGLFGQGEVLSEGYRFMDDFVDWLHIERSWVGTVNIMGHLSSVGRVTELPADPFRHTDSHDLRHVRFGLRRLWDDPAWRAGRFQRGGRRAMVSQ